MSELTGNEENSVVVLSRLEFHTEDKKQWFVFPIHEWPALANRPAGWIYIEGSDGSYRVCVREGTPENYVKAVYVGGMEHALKHAFKLRAKYSRNGLT